MMGAMREPLNNRLRLWRVTEGLTLEEVHDLTGVSVPMLSLAERGKRHFSPQMKVQIARRLGVRISDLFPVDDLSPAEDLQAASG